MIWKLHRDKRREKSGQKRAGLQTERGNICAGLTFFCFFYLASHLQWEQPVNLESLLKICRLLVFPNISQRFDSISGMLSMTLVWNQRTTLENEGGGRKKKSFKEEPLVRVNQQAGGAVTSLQAPPPKNQSVAIHIEQYCIPIGLKKGQIRLQSQTLQVCFVFTSAAWYCFKMSELQWSRTDLFCVLFGLQTQLQTYSTWKQSRCRCYINICIYAPWLQSKHQTRAFYQQSPYRSKPTR